jgi:hypothetical protein
VKDENKKLTKKINKNIEESIIEKANLGFMKIYLIFSLRKTENSQMTF